MVPLLGLALLAHMQVLPVGRAGVLRPAPGVARASLPSAVEDENEDRLVRLDKLLAERGAGSRKDVDRMIRKGLVELDGEIVGKAGAKLKVPWSSTPWADGFDYPPPPLLVGYHKPLGVVSSMRDDRSRPDLSSVLPLPWQKLMHPVGRLDADTTGLLLFSRDGERARLEVASPDGLLALACPCQRRTSASACRPTGDLTHRLLHPKYLVEREYVAEVENEIDAARLGASLAAGVETTEEGESLVVRPASTRRRHTALCAQTMAARSPVPHLARTRRCALSSSPLKAAPCDSSSPRASIAWCAACLPTAGILWWHFIACATARWSSTHLRSKRARPWPSRAVASSGCSR